MTRCSAVPLPVVEVSEADAVCIVLAELGGAARALASAADTLKFIKSPEGMKEVLRAALAASSVSDELREAFHLQWTVRGHRIREALDDDVLLVNVLRQILPPYLGPGLTIYRGEQAARADAGRVGFNWSEDREVAKMFASGLCTLYPGGGVLLQAYAPPCAIISGSSKHSIYLGESELIVDPSRIEDMTELARFSGKET